MWSPFSLFHRFGAWIVAALASLAAILTFRASSRSAGAAGERSRQDAHAATVRDRQLDAALDRPGSLADVTRRLRDPKRKL
jgi:hypothetical protein